ncbi:MAG: ribosome maturation factor RimP [Gaiellaceae bacterium]
MTTTFARERTLQDEIAPAVERGVPGVEVLAVELLSPSRFCVYVDHPEGVDHDLCARVTFLLDAYRSDYTIDVSSPGPERPLRKPRHFADAVGRTINVRTDRSFDGRNRFKGELLEAANGAVTLARAADEPLRIPYEAIVRANVIDTA